VVAECNKPIAQGKGSGLTVPGAAINEKRLFAGVAPNHFAIPFGLAGLGVIWTTAGNFRIAHSAIGEIVLALAALVWAGVAAAYVIAASTTPAKFITDLYDNVSGPFLPLVFVSPMLIGADLVYRYSKGAGWVIVDVFLVGTVVLGGWLTGQWIYGPVDLDKFHPGYFLPTVAGGLIAATSAGVVGQRALGTVMFGLGLICWFLLGSLLLGRLFFRPPLPSGLTPTMPIEIAPAAVASIAWFQLGGEHLDLGIEALAGYGLLMVLAQIRLLPFYLRLPFSLGFWSFTFAWAAVGSVSLHWIHDGRPSGATALSWIVLGAVTLLIGGIFLRTLGSLKILAHFSPPRALTKTRAS
jgi:tellurite resistance protein